MTVAAFSNFLNTLVQYFHIQEMHTVMSAGDISNSLQW